ncbi:MAG: hypothetical protein ABDH61_02050 [Acidilobaceae archaeon]
MARELLRNTRALAVIALIALLLLGVGGYAVFQEIFTAQIEVTVGKFDFEIVDARVRDNESAAGPDIAQCSANIAADRESVSINVQNSYPQYQCNVTLKFLNLAPPNSTIPGKFVGKTVNPPSPVWLNLSLSEPEVAMIVPGDYFYADIVISIRASAPEGGSASVRVSYEFRQLLP